MCGEAQIQLQRLGRLLRFDVEVVDITMNRDLEDEFDMRIPVVRDSVGGVLVEGEFSAWTLISAVVRARAKS
jgi:hypothetical protein